MGGLRLVATFGWLLGCCAVAAVVTAMAAVSQDDHATPPVFLVCAGVMAFVAAALVFGFRGGGGPGRRRHGLALMVAAWTVLPAFAALPFMIIAKMSLAAGYFEAVSAFTTTGATAFASIDALPRGLVFWRAALEWLGGALTILLAVAAFDIARSTGQGGIHLLSAGVANTTRLASVARAVLPLYALATAVCAAALTLTGIPGFDAICLALATLSTGGAMARDGDIAGYGAPAAAIVLVIFMTLGAVSFMGLQRIRPHWPRGRLSSELVRPAILAALVVTVFAALYAARADAHGGTFGASLLEAVFTAVSLASTTAFVHDGAISTGVPLALVMCLVLVGGSYGSTAGGMKIGRVTRMMDAASRELGVLVHPSSVAPGGRARRGASEPQRILWSYFIAYLLAVALVAAMLAGAGLDFAPALLTAAGTISNAGPAPAFLSHPGGLAAIHAGLGEWVTSALSFAMILGRLEILAVLALATPLFWRR